MKDLFHRLLKALNISGRDWVILTLSLLLAFSVWMIHNLSLKYNANLSAKVIAICNLDGHENVSAASAEALARGRATGYNIIESYIKARRPVKVEFNPSVMQRYDAERFFVTGDKLVEYSHLIFGEDITVDHYISDTLFFRFPTVNHKKVPVVPVSILTYKGQYMARGPLDMTPDSVVVAGDPYLLETVKQVYTTPIRHFEISENISGLAGIEPIKGVNIQAKEVYYSMDVVRYVEFVSEVHVEAVNVPAGKAMMIFPSVVTLRMRCEFPLMDDAEGQQTVYVDYNDFKTSVGGSCPVRVKNLPKGILSYDVEPVSVRCVEESR
jgi:hypothetical protein